MKDEGIVMQPREYSQSAFVLPFERLRRARIRPSRGKAWVAVILWTLTAAAAVAGVLLGHSLSDGLDAVVLVTLATVGACIALYRPGNSIGWIMLLGTVMWAVGAVGVDYAARALTQHPRSGAGTAEAAVLGTWARALGWTFMVTFILLLFPTGRLPSSRWRPAAWCAAGYLGLWTVAGLFAPNPADDRFASMHNPFGISAVSGLVNLATALSLPVLIVCGATLVRRFAKARGEERQQLKWLTYGTALPIILTGLALATGNGNLPWPQTVVIVPLAAGIAILRYNLYDIDLLINRTLVYAALTGCVAALYVVAVGGLGGLFQGRGPFIAFVATGLVAVLFQPLRDALQGSINHVMYGRRDDPYAVVSALGRRLEDSLSPEEVLQRVVETVREALMLPYTSLVLEKDGQEISSGFHAPDDRLVSIPLVHQQETVGHLEVTPRRGEADLSSTDYRLLGDLARQAGAAVHAGQLTEELQGARQRLVAAREEERRRLRRDLHDGLGPQMSSQTLTLTAVRKLLRQDPDAAERLLTDAMTHAEEAIKDIRRLVYGLRPPALDDLGLLGALQEVAAQYRLNGLRVTIKSSPLPPLPAAVEVACFRIVQEGLTNVARHARAERCEVRVQVNGAMRLEIIDDGVGLTRGCRAGVGIVSMRERAEELAGFCVLESRRDGGTVVRVSLPLPKEA